jgi:gamma-glutamyltranspeptidase/glutathione hydrolase
MQKLILYSILFLITKCLSAQPINSGYISSDYPFDISKGKSGLVISSSGPASQAAIEILQKGGNAVDAAIAANAVAGLTHPYAGGIGGDLVALIYMASSREIIGLNATGRSPENAGIEKLKAKNIQKIEDNSVFSITVPGCVDGWHEMHQKFGRLPENEILAKAIQLAQYGFIPDTSFYERIVIEYQRLEESQSFTNLYLPNGEFPNNGDLFTNQHLANTYKKLANNGFRSFYDGSIAQTIAKSVENAGGFLTVQDLRNHQSEWVEPISVYYDDFQVFQLPPNNQGIQLLEMLMLYYQFSVLFGEQTDSRYFHALIELKKLASQDSEQFIGDPTFNNFKPERILSPEFAMQRLQAFDTAKAQSVSSKLINNEKHTISVIVADAEGNLVVLSQNNYHGMGSGLVPDSLGFVLQNRASAFSLRKTDANFFGPSRRPSTTFLPSIVLRKSEPYICMNLSDNQLGALSEIQILLNIADRKMNPQKAVSNTMIYHSQLSDNQSESTKVGWTSIEKGLDYQTVREIISLGQRIKLSSEPIEGIQMLMIRTGNERFTGISRTLQKGFSLGY